MNDQEMVEGVVRKALGTMTQTERFYFGKPCPKCGTDSILGESPSEWLCQICGIVRKRPLVPVEPCIIKIPAAMQGGTIFKDGFEGMEIRIEKYPAMILHVPKARGLQKLKVRLARWLLSPTIAIVEEDAARRGE
ncbi:MAG TPA: hypothetical protein VMW71_02775 [Thermoplasmata archaeon]|nr:hypothetical protein [Thermoplasmata archaeon]